MARGHQHLRQAGARQRGPVGLGERLRAVRILPDGESFKTLETLSTIFDRPLLGTKAKVERLSHMTDLVLGYLVRD